MTGFASLSGNANGIDWALDVRSVNARGLDIRTRLPEGLEGLEPELRAALQKGLARGSVQVALKLASGDQENALSINRSGLRRLLEAASSVADAARSQDVELRPMSVGEVLQHRAVIEGQNGGERMEAVAGEIRGRLSELVDALVAARRTEGATLTRIVGEHLARIEELVGAARTAVGDRQTFRAQQLRQRTDALLDAQDRIDEDRLAQELALIAVKSDISEELDRLGAHVEHARTLLQKGGAVGRKLEFLMQEFNREANTLCSKSQDSTLTQVGLDMKVVIDQMREQAANIE